MKIRFFVVTQVAFGKGELKINAVPLFCPGVDINANIDFALKQGEQIGYLLLPYHVFCPSVHIDRTTFGRNRIIVTAEMSYTEGCHESHQFHCRQVILPLYNPFQLLILYGVLLWIYGTVSGNVNHCDLRCPGDYEAGARLVPWIAV